MNVEAQSPRESNRPQLHVLRPSTEVGPEGLTEEQIDEIADAMFEALAEDAGVELEA